MSDPVSALGHASYAGFAQVREIGPLGMITLRAKDGTQGLAEAVKNATGCDLPAVRRITIAGPSACGWMSPDEYLLVVPYGQVAATLAGLARDLAGRHHLAVDVSDARAVIRVEGAKAAQVLQKLAPADFDLMAPDELRRTRTAQVAAAFWAQDGGYTLVCFRSVGRYVFDLLASGAQPGSELA